ncbi:PTS mannitol transporter subunit IICBA [Candidatus Epulonipiscium fishelsonii]|uniref:PTS mannitol transporter subunit IICBA n=1 Tax=Candidatus Epulonipiscium fishelsonii TaxID=77094 RepID=A0ACC8XCH5_9FIRM|nr:PTS mannitol transporter subunit IICBA [Epulopiscium sp. SCG-B11WGA-EpuloA1]
MKSAVQKFGKTLSGMVMPNMGAFIAWGFITALFIPAGWLPNEALATLVGPMLNYLLPILIAYSAGKMFGGDKGAVVAGIAVIGVIMGAPDQAMLIGAMLVGPIAGLCITKFDQAIDGKVKAGFEMLINNFSTGIIGMILAIIGFYFIGPVMTAILSVLTAGVNILITNGLLPFVAIFVEPAKVLFLNNAINHGIFTPIGTEQVAEFGKSIMYMIESNPGPGLGVILAYMVFSKNKTTKASASGASIIQFFGGIHEIYFPYVLMNPTVILGPIIASIATIFYYVHFGAGLVAPAAPGSIIAYLAVAPKGETVIVLGGVAIATAISFIISSIFVKMAGDKDLDAAREQMADMKAQAKGIEFHKNGDIKKVVFACDAGMGSSAMGATKFRNRIANLNLGITVTNTSVDNVPNDADIVVCQEILKERAMKSAPQAQIITIGNFLADPNLDALYNLVSAKKDTTTAQPAPSSNNISSSNISEGVFTRENVKLGMKSSTKQEAIVEAGKLLVKQGYVEEDYIQGMLDREEIATTCLGMGIAIPHGTSAMKKEVLKTGIVFIQYPDGVKFGDEIVNLVFGIGAVGDEHLDVLSKITETLEDDDLVKELKSTTDLNRVMEILQINI